MVQLVGKDVGTVGFGLMGFTARPNPTPNADAIATMKTALLSGANYWNGGEFYGPPERNSLQLLNDYFTKYPDDADKVIICIKGGVERGTYAPRGDEASVRRSVEECLRILDGKKDLDLFECGRVDPNVPIEETIRVLASYVQDGRLKGISLSETSAATIRRAAKVHKISAVEVEVSLFATEIFENGVAETCAELGIPIVAYSPLGRGFLTGELKSIDDLPEDDSRRRFPRFQPGNFERNLELVKEVQRVAAMKACTPGQIAIAWVKSKSVGSGIIPIPGATREERVIENMQEVKLDSSELAELDDIVKKCAVVGTRYPGALNDMCFA